MKNFISALLASVLFIGCTIQSPVSSQENPRSSKTTGQQGVSNNTPLANGVYYIIQGASGEAITPKGITQVTNEIYLKPFNKSGMQKWLVKKQGNGRYLFLPAGNQDLYFTTFKDSPHWTAITDNRVGDTYAIKAAAGTANYFTIHSQYYAGDALRDFLVGGGKEIKFVPLESNTKFYWQFIPAE